jgi:hypothetical protein
VSPLFRNKEKKAERAAQEAAAKAETDRLAALPAQELAVEIMPAFGPDGPGRGNPPEVNYIQLASWLMRPQHLSAHGMRDLQLPLREAVQRLEVAGLVVRHPGSGRLVATAAGQAALAEGTVTERLIDRN